MWYINHNEIYETLKSNKNIFHFLRHLKHTSRIKLKMNASIEQQKGILFFQELERNEIGQGSINININIMLQEP